MRLRCTLCGADVPIDRNSDFIQCTHCRTALFVDAARTIPHYTMEPTVGSEDLLLLLGRKLAAMEITGRPSLESAERRHLSYWRFDTGDRKAYCIATAQAPAEELNEFEAPAGELAPGGDTDAPGDAPDLLPDAAAARIQSMRPDKDPDEYKISLVRLPVYRVVYRLDENRHVAFVEAVSGAVCADEWPPAPQREKDRALGAVALVTVSAFFLEAMFIPSFWIMMTAFVITGSATYLLSSAMLNRMGW